MPNASTTTGPAPHHKPFRTTPSLTTLAPANALAPETPAVANHNIQYYSNFTTSHLLRPPRTLLHRRLPYTNTTATLQHLNQHHSNLTANHLQRPPCTLLHLGMSYRLRLLIHIHGVFVVFSPTIFGEHLRQKTSLVVHLSISHGVVSDLLSTVTLDHFRSHLTEPCSSMPARYQCPTMLSADLRTTQPDHPTTDTTPPNPHITHHGHFLPDNPMPYMAPSVTHQPELLLLHWMISTITTLIDALQHHPIVQDPTPSMASFTDTPAYRLFLQLRNNLRHLINTTYEARRGLNRLQFIPGSPGSPGHYRVDPTLSTALTPTHTTAIPPPTDTPPLLRQLRRRERSRSRDRLPITTPLHPNLTTHPEQPTNSHLSPTIHGHRGQLHRALWTASTSSAAEPPHAGLPPSPF